METRTHVVDLNEGRAPFNSTSLRQYFLCRNVEGILEEVANSFSKLELETRRASDEKDFKIFFTTVLATAGLPYEAEGRSNVVVHLDIDFIFELQRRGVQPTINHAVNKIYDWESRVLDKPCVLVGLTVLDDRFTAKYIINPGEPLFPDAKLEEIPPSEIRELYPALGKYLFSDSDKESS